MKNIVKYLVMDRHFYHQHVSKIQAVQCINNDLKQVALLLSCLENAIWLAAHKTNPKLPYVAAFFYFKLTYDRDIAVQFSAAYVLS